MFNGLIVGVLAFCAGAFFGRKYEQAVVTRVFKEIDSIKALSTAAKTGLAQRLSYLGKVFFG